jgi:hypothetical protein
LLSTPLLVLKKEIKKRERKDSKKRSYRRATKQKIEGRSALLKFSVAS